MKEEKKWTRDIVSGPPHMQEAMWYMLIAFFMMIWMWMFIWVEI
jgi:hypothetical protein